MALVLRTAPAVEPVALEEVKAHLRVDGDAEDALIASLALTSRLHIEAALGLALVTQGWTLQLDRWPRDGVVKIPLWPVASIDEVRVIDADGLPQTIAPASFTVDVASRPARIVVDVTAMPRPGRSVAGIGIDFVAGYGPDANAVPAPLRQALMLLIAHWYEHRDPIEVGAPSTVVPHSVNRLLVPYRPVRL